MAMTESTTEIRPFSVEVPEEDLVDLRKRIAATRWPEKETVADETHQAYPKLIYFNEVDEGDHFAAWQEPELFTHELRAAFRPLRTNNDQGRSS
jgi:hypothetical protein